VSSPIANQKPTFFHNELVGFHQKAAHKNRILRLSQLLGHLIFSLRETGQKRVMALDVGCGDMTIAENISREFPDVEWKCTDIHPLPPNLNESEKWKKYCQFDGRRLPFDNGSFDVVLFSDVLHHCMPQAATLLQEAARVGKYIVVKDHYELSWFSRQMLRFMDFFGNYGYGIKIPSRYFTPKSFVETCEAAGLRLTRHEHGIDLYSAFPILKLMINSRWQFLAVLEKA
jgi:ubiquinone/menaquinone biosynthesis C-methylase UbiE